MRYKERFETEIEVGKTARWPRALETLGFRTGFRYEKFRTSFRLGDLHLDLDETPIGIFLELEGSPAAIRRTARALGYAPKDYIRATYWDLYVADCRRLKRIPRNMVFKSKKYR
jgi:adenylate cyclase, class 2